MVIIELLATHWKIIFAASIIMGMAALGVGWLFFHLKDQITLSRKIESLSGRVIIPESTDLLRKMKDTSTEDTILRLFPTLRGTKIALRHAGLKVDLVGYIAFILITSAIISLLWNNPLIPSFADALEPIFNIAALHFIALLIVIRPMVRRRKARMLDQLSLFVSHVARSLQAGQSIDVSLSLATNALKAPLKSELDDVVKLISVGISAPEALAAAALNIDLPEFDFFISAVEAADRSGGNLSRVLKELVNVIRGRTQIKLKIGAKTAESKLSAAVLAMLPLGLFGFFCVFDYPYVAPLFKEQIGHYLLGGAFGLIGLGLMCMMWMIRLKV